MARPAPAVAAAVAAALVGVLLHLAPPAARAAGPVDVYTFPDAASEARYRALIAEFRCPKCLNTNLAGSDAPIAQDLRRTVHRLLVQDGAGDDEIRRYLQERYGDFVLYDPPFRPDTWVLWLGPAVLLAVGVWVLVRVLRQPARVALDAEDRKRLDAILERE